MSTTGRIFLKVSSVATALHKNHVTHAAIFNHVTRVSWVVVGQEAIKSGCKCDLIALQCRPVVVP